MWSPDNTPRPIRQPRWTSNRVERTIVAAVLAALIALPVGLACGAWSIFQPAAEPKVGPVSAYLVAGGLLCAWAGWYYGYRKRQLELERSVFGPWPGYLAVALAAATFGIWTAHVTATVHTPEASLAFAHDLPLSSPAPAVPTQADPTARPTSRPPTGDPHTCAGGNPAACSNNLALIQNDLDGLVEDLRSVCQPLLDAANSGVAGWTPPAQLVTSCNSWLHGLSPGTPATKPVADKVAQDHGLFNELARYARWPPPNR